jgi:hypothetical protein
MDYKQTKHQSCPKLEVRKMRYLSTSCASVIGAAPFRDPPSGLRIPLYQKKQLSGRDVQRHHNTYRKGLGQETIFCYICFFFHFINE